MNKAKTTGPLAAAAPGKRVALYARVSSEEQTRGHYPSCVSQVEELESACRTRGWQVHRIIKDEGFSAGSLKRPGLTELRWLVETGEINALVCTWYDRLTRSRDFYVLDKEFQAHGVEFITLHDPTDTTTAAGRFMECMLVAAKTYEREQTSEKVRSKMQMRAEKGMWNGGPIPFGFVAVDAPRSIAPDPQKHPIVNGMFRVYVETGSDFKVRDWLKAHQVPTREGRQQWQVSTICKLLRNRRYIAQIEINRDNKGIDGLSEAQAYRIASAPYEPLVPVEVFELAQKIRQQKSVESPHRVGRPRSYSQTQCNRVYPLQGLLICGHCGHAMAPWYVRHRAGEDKSGKKRKTDSFVNYYLCAKQQKNWKGSDHKNCALAHRCESWILARVHDLATEENLIEQALDQARERATSDLQPVREAWEETSASLRQVEADIEKLVGTISQGQAVGALWDMLNEKAFRLKFERDQLLNEQRRLQTLLAPAEMRFDAVKMRAALADFDRLIRHALPEEVQRLMRLLVRRIEWMPEGNHKVQFYALHQQSRVKTNCPPAGKAEGQWFHTVRHFDSP